MMQRHVEHVMGTVVSLALRTDGMSAAEIACAVASACEVLDDADATFSTFKPNSELSRLRRGEVRIEQVSDEMNEIIDRCVTVLKASDGWFDAWSLPGGFDPTGIVKGWAADRALAALRDHDVPAAMVNAGGDIVAYGEPEPGRAWRMGVRDSEQRDILRAVVELNGALATSGTYERGEHIHRPKPVTAPSDWGVTALRSASVTGPELATADALATALFAAGPYGLQFIEDTPGYDAFIVDDSGTGWATAGFPAADA